MPPIRVNVLYKDILAYVPMPSLGETVDVDFEGQYLIELRNIDGHMEVTGIGVDGGGNPLLVTPDDVKTELVHIV